MNKKDFRYFDVARSISLASSFPRIRIGAIVVCKNHIISFGVNSVKSHPIQKKYNVHRFTSDDTPHSLHAEIHALVSIPRGVSVEGATMYIYRENKKGRLAKSRPCPSCMSMIKDYGIRRICYTTEDGYCEEIITDRGE